MSFPLGHGWGRCWLLRDTCGYCGHQRGDPGVSGDTCGHCGRRGHWDRKTEEPRHHYLIRQGDPGGGSGWDKTTLPLLSFLLFLVFNFTTNIDLLRLRNSFRRQSHCFYIYSKKLGKNWVVLQIEIAQRSFWMSSVLGDSGFDSNPVACFIEPANCRWQSCSQTGSRDVRTKFCKLSQFYVLRPRDLIQGVAFDLKQWCDQIQIHYSV